MKIVFRVIIISFFLTSCQTAKDAFTLKKKSSTDEFLVEKKSPLVLPPDYGKLPIPGTKEKEERVTDNNEIKTLVTNDNQNLSTQVEKNTKPSSIEQSILKEIE